VRYVQRTFFQQVTTVSLGALVLIAVAGVLAGGLNTAAGGGTLVSYPALLLAGLPPLSANVTSAIGLIPGYVGGAAAYRSELEELRPSLRKYLPLGVLGGIAGAALLLITPPSAFENLAPYLVLGGSLLFLGQPALSARMAARGRPAPSGHDLRALIGIAVTSAYGSYFSAGVGVMYLAVLGLLTAVGLQHANALKNLLSVAAVGAGALVYVWSDHVHWDAVAVLLVSSLIGGYLGGRVARRMSPRTLRALVGATGLVVGFGLLISSW